jgi:hypothetical protein
LEFDPQEKRMLLQVTASTWDTPHETIRTFVRGGGREGVRGCKRRNILFERRLAQQGVREMLER